MSVYLLASRRAAVSASALNGRAFFSSSVPGLASSYDNILVEKRGRVGLITLNRPKALNALCDALIADVNHATTSLDADPDTGAIVITGSEKAFAAGADIKEMAPRGYVESYSANKFSEWADIMKVQTPIIAAVNGFALGGGCEMAMQCDILLAGEKAKFGQPEIKLGTIPGCGGTQRLIRAVGKSKAMAMCLTGDMMGAEEAHARGLVAEVHPPEQLVERAVEMGASIAEYSKPITQMVKETVNAAEELSLSQGLRFERRVFHATFSTNDRREGMSAFVDKRNPEFKHD